MHEMQTVVTDDHDLFLSLSVSQLNSALLSNYG